jgi:cystathionine beta-lyase/cystathionine gamma-synthase
MMAASIRKIKERMGLQRMIWIRLSVGVEDADDLIEGTHFIHQILDFVPVVAVVSIKPN